MENTRQILSNKLIQGKRFWSFNMPMDMEITDDILIEKSLIYLDIEDINRLFVLFPAKKIKNIWLQRLVIQGEYYYKLNRLLAWLYFDIKNPDKYIKKITNQHFKKLP